MSNVSLGSEFVTWAQERAGKTCVICGSDVEYTPEGMEDGQSTHSLECGCTRMYVGPSDTRTSPEQNE